MKKVPAFAYFFPGLFFGFILLRAEVVSWFRIQEMFHFQSFHMYGTIGSAVAVGAISILLIKRFKAKSIEGQTIVVTPPTYRWKANVIGGTLFGLGWAVAGACPGPIYSLIGARNLPYVLVFVGAALGAVMYDFVKTKLPH
jgi:uncharacterized membrane protein YedE/YeeE